MFNGLKGDFVQGLKLFNNPATKNHLSYSGAQC